MTTETNVTNETPTDVTETQLQEVSKQVSLFFENLTTTKGKAHSAVVMIFDTQLTILAKIGPQQVAEFASLCMLARSSLEVLCAATSVVYKDAYDDARNLRELLDALLTKPEGPLQ